MPPWQRGGAPPDPPKKEAPGLRCAPYRQAAALPSDGNTVLPSSILTHKRKKNSILILFQWIMKQFILYYLDNKPPHEQDSNVSCLRGKKDLLVGKYWERKADKDQFQLQLLPGAGEQASVVFWGPGKAKNCECLSLLVGVKVETATNNFLFLFA